LLVPLTRASFTPQGWQAAEECPLSRLVLAGTGFVCPSWSCLQLCQNLGGKRADSAAGVGTAWEMAELSKCP